MSLTDPTSPSPPQMAANLALDAIADALRLTDSPAALSQGGTIAGVEWSAGRVLVSVDGVLVHFRVDDAARPALLTRTPAVVRAPIPGVIVETSDASPIAGQLVATLEAMKTLTRVVCPTLPSSDTATLELLVSPGDAVVEGQALAVLRLTGMDDALPDGVLRDVQAPPAEHIVAAWALGAPLTEAMLRPFIERLDPAARAAVIVRCALDTLVALDRRPSRRADGGLDALPPVERARAWRLQPGYPTPPPTDERLLPWHEAWCRIGCTASWFQTRILEACARRPERTVELLARYGPQAPELLASHDWRPDPAETPALLGLYAGIEGAPPAINAWVHQLEPRAGVVFGVDARRLLSGTPETPTEIRASKLIGRALHPAFIVELVLGDLPGATIVEHPPVDGRSIGVKVATVAADALRFVLILSDPTVAFASLSNDECAAVADALDRAQADALPVVWFAMSSGARIDRETGTENLDGTAHTLRRIVEFGESGGRMFSVVVGPCVGAQAYWLAASGATLGSQGVLVMTPSGSLVLSGTRALEFSGSYGAPDERAIGGFCTAGSQGHAAYYAADVPQAWSTVRAMLELSAVPQTMTADSADRSVAGSLVGSRGESAREVIGLDAGADRRAQYAIRPLMQALFDSDSPVLYPWDAWAEARQAVVARGRIGGVSCTVIGVDQQTSAPEWAGSVARGSQFHAGTLYPESSRKIARAIHAAGDEPVVLLANLAGFDSSPDSLLAGQLGAGAEIAGAVATRRAPLLVCVLTRYHGGAFVVFSKRLGADVTSIALQGSFASVIGGVPAAAIVFSRDVDALAAQKGGGAGARGEALTEIGRAFDEHHSVQRALRMGSIDAIIGLDALRSSIAAFNQKARS